MPIESEKKIRVERLFLEQDRDKTVAVADVRVGDLLVRGLKIWRSPNGSLCVFFPSHKFGPLWEEVVSLPDELRAEVEAEVISAYKATQVGAQKLSRNDKGEQKNAK